MSLGRMSILADIVRPVQKPDKDGFPVSEDVVIASVRVYREGRHGSLKWANLSAFSEATDLFRFRKIPGITVDEGCALVTGDGRFQITSVEDVKSRGMYLEVLAKKTEAAGYESDRDLT